jgi:hypothetical protein
MKYTEMSKQELVEEAFSRKIGPKKTLEKWDEEKLALELQKFDDDDAGNVDLEKENKALKTKVAELEKENEKLKSSGNKEKKKYTTIADLTNIPISKEK